MASTSIVDANSGFSPKRAIEVGKLLVDNEIGHFEEPCPYWRYDQTAEVRSALPINITGGEQDCEISSWQLMLEHESVDILQLDVMYMGGIHRTLEICQMGQAAGLKIPPHAANLSLVTMCTMHLLKAIPNAGKYLELSIEGFDYYPWQEGLFLDDPYSVRYGHVTVPDGPGRGVEINRDWLEKADYKASALLLPVLPKAFSPRVGNRDHKSPASGPPRARLKSSSRWSCLRAASSQGHPAAAAPIAG
jgi:L-alanine-DL-glutamate epimerase-like enolase superfamily enzyme